VVSERVEAERSWWRTGQAKGLPSRVAHYSAYVFAAMIVLAATGCVWAIAESRKPGVSAEVLMVLPGLGCVSLYAGVVVLACTVIAWPRLSRLERIGGCLFVSIGLGMLPALMALEFLGLIY
jgi:hypothetical protein